MHNSRELWAISSAGRASALQAECQQFDPVIAHQREAIRDGCFFFGEIAVLRVLGKGKYIFEK